MLLRPPQNHLKFAQRLLFQTVQRPFFSDQKPRNARFFPNKTEHVLNLEGSVLYLEQVDFFAQGFLS